MAGNTKLINQNIQSQRALADEAIKDLHELAIRINNEEIAQRVSDMRNRIHDPYMFVIVGEVKAGKSSFINALLEAEKEITAVAAHPMTDTIQQIIYGEVHSVTEINPFLKQITEPVEILKEIAIVDTPGTNTIIENHQTITEDFIPAADLIVFVFEAKNPYRQSSWEFFDFIREEWRKKIIFVLQQKDLLPPEDLQTNINGVAEYAEKKGIKEPVIFAVSAKMELEGDTANSGFAKVREYIKENITGGKAPILKLQNTLDTGIRISETVEDGLKLRHKQLKADQDFRADITETLDQQEKTSNKQVDVLVENILAGYDRITRQKEQELREGLSFFTLVRRSFASIFSRKASITEWLENLARELEEELNTELKLKLNSGIDDLSDSIQQMAKLIDLKIRNSTTILENDHEVFSNIAEKRNNVFKELHETFQDFIKSTENFTDRTLFPDKSPIGSGIATGSGLAVVGIIITAVTNGIVFDITGGVITAIGLVFASVATSGKRRKVIRSFTEEIIKGRKKIEEDVTATLKTYIHRLKEKIDDNFFRFDLMLEREEEDLKKLDDVHAQVDKRLKDIRGQI